jgi:hypothetical protein
MAKKKLTAEQRARSVSELRELQGELRALIARLEAKRHERPA